MWPSDLADLVRREFVVALGVQGAEQFEDMRNKASLACGNAGDLHKNTIYIGNLLSLLKEHNVTSQTLDKLCNVIIAFGGKDQAAEKQVPEGVQEALFPPAAPN